MKNKVVFEKKYSNLGEFQSEHESVYSIVTDEDGKLRHGITIADKNESGVVSNSAIHLTDDYEQVLKLLQYMYENGISSQSLQDIIHDCKVKGII